jgi:hypothetical protein
MAAAAPVDAAGEKLARGEASQADAFPAEVCLVGVPHVKPPVPPCRPRHADPRRWCRPEPARGSPGTATSAGALWDSPPLRAGSGGAVGSRRVPGGWPGRLAGALDPDRPHHPRQSRQRRTLNVRLHHGHPRTEAPNGIWVSQLTGGVADGLVEDRQAEREFVLGGGQWRGDPENAAHAGQLHDIHVQA